MCWFKKKRGNKVDALNIAALRFEVKQEVLEQLRAYAQNERNEQCGVLTGSKINDKTYRISKVSPPCVANNTRCRCERDAKKANEFIRNDYEQSSHTRTYMGEWHTHPEPCPRPSWTDSSSIISNFKESALDYPFLIMSIVGTETLYFSVYDGVNFNTIEPIEV